MNQLFAAEACPSPSDTKISLHLRCILETGPSQRFQDLKCQLGQLYIEILGAAISVGNPEFLITITNLPCNRTNFSYLFEPGNRTWKRFPGPL